MLFSFYSLEIAVIQYRTFSIVRLLTPAVILILPIPVSLYSIIIIRSNGFWFAFPGFGFLTDTFLAPVLMSSIVCPAGIMICSFKFQTKLRLGCAIVWYKGLFSADMFNIFTPLNRDLPSSPTWSGIWQLVETITLKWNDSSESIMMTDPDNHRCPVKPGMT